MAEEFKTPTDYKSGLEQVLKEASNIYQQKKAAGYPTYTGQQIAGFAPEELAAMQGISSLVGAGQSYFTPAAQMLQGTARQFTPTEAATYMSPYQQAVVDVEKREAARAFPQQMQNIASQAAGAGSFGGSRQAILEAEAMRNQNQLLADIQTRGSARAFDTAQRAFESQLQRERQAASGLTSLGQVAPRQALAELTALSGIGEAQRGMTQAGLDIAKQQFERQQQYPYDLLGQYQSTLYGYPYQAFQQFQPVRKPSSAQNLAGILGAVGKIGGSFGLFKEGGHVAFRSQGGLSGMVQKLAAGSSVGTTTSETPRKKTYREQLMDAALALQTDLDTYKTETKAAQEEKAKLAKEQREKLMKQTSPTEYVSDLLIGYAMADPEAGTGAQVAAAAEYAGGIKDAAEEQIRQIQQDLADGKISMAEANIKIRQAQISGLADIAEILTPTDYTAGATKYGKFSDFAKDLGVASVNIDGLITQARNNVLEQIGDSNITEEAQEEMVMAEMRKLAPTFKSSGLPLGTSVSQGVGDNASMDESVDRTPDVQNDTAGDILKNLGK